VYLLQVEAVLFVRLNRLKSTTATLISFQS